MIINTKNFKEVCSNILQAIDNSEVSTLTETLELKTEGNYLYLNVTNREYYASAKFELDASEEFHATVSANTFLKLIAATTSETIELTTQTNYLNVKSNGNYKFPFIFEDDHLLELPQIVINNPTVEMNVSGETLNSILQFNSKELNKANIAQPIQKLYYVDQEGCITFTTGACVNSFKLEKPIQILLNNRLVKLFKLFKNDLVHFTLGYDSISETILQVKVCFETPNIKLTAITPSDDSLLAKVPVTRIRGLANKENAYTMVVNKESFLQSINRLLLFNDSTSTVEFTFTPAEVTLKLGDNVEKLVPENGSSTIEDYNMLLNINNLKTVLETCTEQYITMCYGDHAAITLHRGSIINVIPETIRR